MEYTKFFISMAERRTFLSPAQMNSWTMIVFLEGKIEAMYQSQCLVNVDCRKIQKQMLGKICDELHRYTTGKTPEKLFAGMLLKDVAGVQ